MILVTGGAGFIGSVLCRRLLSRRYQVHCLDNFYHSTPQNIADLCTHPNFSFEKFDVSNVYGPTEPVEAIIHLAGLVGFPQCSKQQSLSRLWNVQATENIVSLANDLKCKLLFASTGSVYGKIDNICTEDSPINPVSTYGIHKAEAERIIGTYQGSISLRFATGFGVSLSQRFDLLPNTFVFKALQDRVLDVFEGYAKRTFIPVDDMAESFIFCLENYSNSKYPVYNCGSEQLNLTKYDLAKIIQQYTWCKIQDIPGNDPDLRNYEVDYSRLRKFGLSLKCDIEEEILKLIKVFKLYV